MPKTNVVPTNEVTRFITDVMMKLGVPKEQANQFGQILVAEDCRGKFEEGLKNMEFYIGEIQAKHIDVHSTARIIAEGPASAWVNGSDTLGPVTGEFCMKLAVEKATSAGVGIVVVRGVRYVGTTARYSQLALRYGMIGVMFSNTPPTLVPTRATQAVLGYNPCCVAAPTKKDMLVFNMNFTTLSPKKLDAMIKRSDPIPNDCLYNQKEKISIDNCAIHPLGGLEETAGHKGYGLSLMVEILCGVLAGSSYGDPLPHHASNHAGIDLGMCFIAINPENFSPGFSTRMDELISYLRNMIPLNINKPVLAPGDPERVQLLLVERHGGIQYPMPLLKAMTTLAKSMDIQPMQSRSL